MADKAYLDKDGLAEVWSAVEDQVAEASEEIIKVKTVSGDIVSVDDASAYPFLDITADINPIQDLHGYDKPWAGGNGKNILQPPNPKSDTHKGIIFTYEADGSVSISGTTTGTDVFNNFNYTQYVLKIPKEVPLKISYETVNGDASYIRAMLCYAPSGGPTTLVASSSGGDVQGTIPSTAVSSWVRIYVNAPVGTSVNCKIKPMVRLASETDPTWEPYSNICPISGWTEEKIANMSDISKRQFFNGLLDGTYGFVDLGTLEWIYNSSLLRFDGLIADIKIQSQRTLPLLCPLYTAITDGAQFDENWNMVIYNNHNNARILVHNHSYTDEASFKTAMSGVYLIYPLETPTTPTITEAQFNMLLEQFGIDGKLYVIDLGGTRYGGTLDVTSGVMNVTKKFIELDGSSDETWTYISTYQNIRLTLSDANVDGIPSEQLLSDCYIGNYVRGKDGYAGSGIMKTYISASDNTYVFFTSDISDVSIWRTYLASNPIQLVYPLATPLTVQLTPTQIEALVGENNVWASTGAISVKYAKMGDDMYDLAAANKLYIDQLVEEKNSKFSPVGFSGELVSFEANQEYPLLDLNVDIDPVQDLHGYSKPWAGGNGKNKLPMTVSGIKAANTGGTWSGNTYTNNGVTFELNIDVDGNITDIVVNGSVPGNTSINLYFPQFHAISGTQYTISGSPSGKSNTTYRLWVQGDSFTAGNRLSDDQESRSTATASATADNECFIQIFSGATYSNLVFYPMIRLASASADFEPYSNICPISGWDEAEVSRTGKNLLPITASSATTSGITFTVNTDGSIHVQGTATSTAYFYPCGSSFPKHLVGKSLIVTGGKDGVKVRAWHYDGTSNAVSENGNTSPTFTIAGNGVFDIIVSSGTTVNTTIYPMVVRSTETDFSWQPFGNTFIIDLGETRYGCKLNVPSGKLVVTHGLRVLNGSESWVKSSLTVCDIFCLNDMSYNLKTSDTITSLYPFVNQVNYNILYYAWWDSWNSTQGRQLRIGFSESGTTTLEQFKEWLANNPLQVYAKLATPVEIQLDPTEITTLLGTNYIWADTGDIDGQYAQLTDDFKDLSMADRRAMSILIEQKLREHGLIS